MLHTILKQGAALGLALCLALPGIAGAQEATPASGGARAIELPKRISDLSPDGRSIAAYDGDAFCVYEVESLQETSCADLKSKKIRVRADDIVWSPDSTRIAFAETGFQTFVDGDLWVMNAASGELTNLTDDGYQGNLMNLGRPEKNPRGAVYMDVLPAWSPDGTTIAFSRSPFIDGKQTGNSLMTIPAGGGETTTITTVNSDIAGVLYWGLAWAPDARSIVYSYIGISTDDPDTGVWTVDAGGGDPTRIIGGDSELGGPAMLSINAAGTTALLYYVQVALGSATPRDVYWLLDLKSGERTPVKLSTDPSDHAFTASAAFSPDGSKLLFTSSLDGSFVLVERDLAAGNDETLYTGARLMSNAAGRGLVWATDGTIFATTNLREAVILHKE